MKRRENDVTYSGYAGTDAARLPEFEESCRSTFFFWTARRHTTAQIAAQIAPQLAAERTVQEAAKLPGELH